MAYLQRRHNRFRARVRVPKPLVATHGGREFLERTLRTADRRAAKAEAMAWEAQLRAEWAVAMGHDTKDLAQARAVYQAVKSEALGGAYVAQPAHPLEHDGDPAIAGIDLELQRLADMVAPDAEPPTLIQAKVAALNDAAAELQGRRTKPRKELEPTFGELVEDFMRAWKSRPGRKPTNTEQQKRATYALFGSYCGNRPIREVRKRDAALFMDALRQLDPHWPRSVSTRELGWQELQATFGGRERGLSDATINRHAAALAALWEWASERDYCEGRNPFHGFHTPLRKGVNVAPYVAWEQEELVKLWSPLPKRTDLAEVMVVAMFSGMRIDEIAGLRWRDMREEAGVPVFDIRDAKTVAGQRLVPVHPRLGWLLARDRGAPDDRIWSTFNPEGPGGKPGADASREFSRLKAQRGFNDRRKSFHSFRKNAIGQWERLGVPEGEVAQIVGHEKAGFTFRTYGAAARIERLAEVVAMLDYPEVPLPSFGPSPGSA